MKLLDGKELAGYVTERQARQVRALRQAHGIFPKLAIIVTVDNPVIDIYTRLKKNYGQDILIDVDIHKIPQSEARALIQSLNTDNSVHGIVVQLPLADTSETDAILDLINPEKDIDGLGEKSKYVSATATAINWLLAGYNIELRGKRIAVVGLGRLVGKPLFEGWKKDGLDVYGYDENSVNLSAEIKKADVVISATGVARLIKSDMLSLGAVVVDAGTASDSGKIVGDLDAEARNRDDLTITPEKGGVGPLTIAVLFDNLIQAARLSDQEPA